ncbi:MAG: mechanosensitive ion channel domain-containing protein, partial [Candidatus Methanoperedens sp.]
RYTLRKAISTILWILGLGALLAVWFQETTTLVVAYGLLSAGVAIALQDVLKNVAGGIIIFFSSPFKAGDRIQVDNDLGDVLDIKLFYTTLMEIREWVDGDQYTGRISQIPNGFVLNKTVKNYTKDFSFIWDELHIMVTYDTNLKKAQEIALKIAHDIADPFKVSATKELNDLGEKYLITPSDVDEQIYTKITDNWVDLRLRYVVDPRQRRIIKRSLYEKLLEAFNREKDIKIASATFEIVGFPKIKIEK